MIQNGMLQPLTFDYLHEPVDWDLFLNAPAPVGYDPAIISAWMSPTTEAFAVIRLEPWRLQVFPGSLLSQQVGEVLTWRENLRTMSSRIHDE